MARIPVSESTDTRVALRAYAALLIMAGVVAAGWAPLWLGSHLHELAWGRAALIRMAGAVLPAAGVFAVGLSAEDSAARKRMLSWFIASLAISEETIKTHVGHVLAKLQVDNRTQALVQALKRGLIALEELE